MQHCGTHHLWKILSPLPHLSYSLCIFLSLITSVCNNVAGFIAQNGTDKTHEISFNNKKPQFWLLDTTQLCRVVLFHPCLVCCSIRQVVTTCWSSLSLPWGKQHHFAEICSPNGLLYMQYIGTHENITSLLKQRVIILQFKK